MVALMEDNCYIPQALTDITPRQSEVAELLAAGLTDKQIAGKLGMQYNTVRVHVVALAYRLSIPPNRNTRVMIARWWMEHHPAKEVA